jgi:hypothetical protein
VTHDDVHLPSSCRLNGEAPSTNTKPNIVMMWSIARPSSCNLIIVGCALHPQNALLSCKGWTFFPFVARLPDILNKKMAFESKTKAVLRVLEVSVGQPRARKDTKLYPASSMGCVDVIEGKKRKKFKVPPRISCEKGRLMDPTYCEFELGSLDSESKVLTVTPWDLFVMFRKIFKYIKALRNSEVLTIRGRDGMFLSVFLCLVKNALAASLPQLRLCLSPQHKSRDKDQRTRRGRGKH